MGRLDEGRNIRRDLAWLGGYLRKADNLAESPTRQRADGKDRLIRMAARANHPAIAIDHQPEAAKIGLNKSLG